MVIGGHVASLLVVAGDGSRLVGEALDPHAVAAGHEALDTIEQLDLEAAVGAEASHAGDVAAARRRTPVGESGRRPRPAEAPPAAGAGPLSPTGVRRRAAATSPAWDASAPTPNL